jgi:AcrR family transcriptional regulator
MSEESSVNGAGLRAQRRREQTRQDLLSAARRVLSRHGFHQTKIIDIAGEAGVAVGTFYLYYPTKEALFLEMVEDAVHLLKADIDRLESPSADPIQRARAGCETFFRFAQENRDLFRIVFAHGVTFHGVAHRAQELFVSGVAANLAAGMRAGVFRTNRPDVVAQAFTGMLLQVVSWWIEQENIPVSEVTESLLKFAFRGLLVERSLP